MRQLLGDAGMHVVQTPCQASNANAYGSCGPSSMSASTGWCPSVSATFDAPSRNSSITTIANGITQGLENRLIDGSAPRQREGAIRRRLRLGGLLSYYERAA